MVRTKIKSITRFDLFSIHEIPAIIVFVMMMVLVGFSWRTANRAIGEARSEEVSERARYAETNIKQRILLNENTLRASAALFNGGDVSKEQWRQYVNSLNLSERMPAIIGIGYSQFYTPDQLPAHIAAMKQMGYPDFAINPPEPKRDIYSSISLIEPMNDRNRQAIGGDLYAEPIRHQAMDQARDNATTSMSEITLVLQDATTQKNGITLFHPIYKLGAPTETLEQRRTAIMGFVYAPLSAERLFGQIFPEKDQDFNFKIYDADSINEESLLYEQLPGTEEAEFMWIQEDRIDVADQSWVIKFGVKNTIVPETIRQRPGGIIFGGTLFAMLVAATVYLLLQKRNRIISTKQDIKLQRAKDSLLSLASHQLRTPATGVKQYIGMVLEGFVGTITKDQRELLTKAYDSNERQLRIINEFLYLAKADAGRIVLSPQQFDLLELCKTIINDMNSEIEDAGHKLTLKTRTKHTTIHADVYGTRMVIENLISNAVKYTPTNGSIEVTIRKNKNTVYLSVRDNGVGIDKKDFPKLFKQFSRIPNELTKQTSGSGIGLYLAHYLTELNGGTITVESRREVGSTFTVTFNSKDVKKLTDKTKKRK